MVFLPRGTLELILSYYVGFHDDKANRIRRWWQSLVSTWKLREKRKAYYRDSVTQRNGYSPLSIYYYQRALQRREQKVGVYVEIIGGDNKNKKGKIVDTTPNFIRVKDSTNGLTFWTPRGNGILQIPLYRV